MALTRLTWLHFIRNVSRNCKCRGYAEGYATFTQKTETLALGKHGSRLYSVSSVPPTMSAWQISRYGGIENLYLSEDTPSPVIRRPDEVVIQVHAASVNPIDTKMLKGYGSATINPLRKVLGTSCDNNEFPLTLGRDFSGTIVKTGVAVPSQRFKPGDEVWGAISASSQGTHAEYIVASALEISKKPATLSHREAASIPYVAATTWSAVSTVGWMSEGSSRNRRVLIFGGSGGIGTFATQLFKAWGADVTVTCASDAIPMMQKLGVDNIIDYETQDMRAELLAQRGQGFDFILDGVGKEDNTFVMDILKSHTNATYVTIVLPILKNNDEMGLPLGIAKSAVSLGLETLTHLREGKHYRWALFLPNGRALSKIAKLVDEGKIQPVIEKIYSFQDTPAAFEKVMAEHSRGKTIIDMEAEETDECVEKVDEADTFEDSREQKSEEIKS